MFFSNPPPPLLRIMSYIPPAKVAVPPPPPTHEDGHQGAAPALQTPSPTDPPWTWAIRWHPQPSSRAADSSGGASQRACPPCSSQIRAYLHCALGPVCRLIAWTVSRGAGRAVGPRDSLDRRTVGQDGSTVRRLDRGTARRSDGWTQGRLDRRLDRRTVRRPDG